MVLQEADDKLFLRIPEEQLPPGDHVDEHPTLEHDAGTHDFLCLNAGAALVALLMALIDTILDRKRLAV